MDFATDYRERIKNTLENETGYQRIVRMYSLNEYGWISPELRYILRSGTTTAALAGIFGGLKYMKQARDDFLRRNVASTFESAHLARRKLTDTISLSGIKGAAKYSLKFGSFSFLYLLSTLTVANYNNKMTVWEHMLTCAVLGSASRLNYGLKGMASAGVLGGVLGLFAGGVIVGSMWITGTDFQDFLYEQHDSYYTQLKKSSANNH